MIKCSLVFVDVVSAANFIDRAVQYYEDHCRNNA